MTAKVQLPAIFKDRRGEIQPIVMEECNDVALITSKKGAIRANHYHKTDSHYSYVLSGKIRYLTRPVDSIAPPSVELIGAGELFYTPSNLEHLMFFEEDTVFLNVSLNNRDKEKYEDDVVRVTLDKFL